MPFDPSKPANYSPVSSAEMRRQLTSLNADIQQRATINELNNAIANAIQQTSNNSNGVGTLGQGAAAATTRVRCKTRSTRWMS